MTHQQGFIDGCEGLEARSLSPEYLRGYAQGSYHRATVQKLEKLLCR